MAHSPLDLLGLSVMIMLPAVAAAPATHFLILPVLPLETALSAHWLIADPASNQVYHPQAKGILMIDGATNLIVNTIDLGAYPTSAASDPSVVRRLYVTHADEDRISVIGMGPGMEPGLLLRSLAVGPGPGLIAVDSATHFLVVVFPDSGATLILDPYGGFVGRLPYVGKPAVDSVRGEVYLLREEERDVLLFNESRGDLLAMIPLSPEPHKGFALDAQRRHLYVSNFDTDGLTAVDVDAFLNGKRRAIDIIDLGQEPWAVAMDELHNRVYVAEHEDGKPGTLWIVDGKTHRVRHTVHLSADGQDDETTNLCYDAHALAVNPDTRRAYVPCGSPTVGLVTVAEFQSPTDLLPPT